MFEPTVILLSLITYMGGLFILARWAQRRSETATPRPPPWIYALSIGVYCTSWTFYGSVGAAANDGISFLTIYFGPTLVLLFGGTLLLKLVRLKSRHHITSIADLISTRYNKSQLLAALVTLICLIGILPYIALQLKAVTTTFGLISSQQTASSGIDVELVTVVMMILFTILFGVRHLDPTERHQGMMYALAAESIVKLLAFTAAGLFVTFGLFDGFDDLFDQAEALRSSLPALNNLTSTPPFANWITLCLLAMAAFTFLPRQFHVAVVENADEAHIGTAQWMVPAYLLLINLFVLPIAAAGLILGMGATQADSFVLQLPLMADQRWLSMLVFIGGFSAATGMILISAMTLSTMITNHLILPLIEALPSLHPLRSYLLQWRWLSVTLFIVAGALFNRTVGESYMLVNMGLISFAAVLQFAPAIIGGLFWRQGNARGALAGLLTGFIVWLYTLLLPAFTKSGWIAPYWLDQGPFGIAILRPEGLLGFSQLDPLPHSVFWSLGLNILAYIGFSVASRASKDEQALADEFIDVLLTAERPAPMLAQENTTDLEPKLDCLNRCFSDYMSAEASATSIAQCVRSTGLEERTTVNLMEIAYLQKEAEILLAGAIGGASAHRAIQRSDLFTSAEQEELSGLYSHFLAEIQLTPEELLSKIDYYQEREQMITDHASEQARTIDRLESEVDQREQAEQALKELNEELEQRVKYRTATLRHTNEKLGETLNELISTQDKLVETEKMAALGELVAGVAHEINTPVGNSITSATYLKEVVNELNEQMEEGKLTRQGLDEIRQIIGEASDLIYTNLTRASELVSSFKQIAVDQANEAAQRFNVSRNLQQTLVSLKHNLKKAGCEVSVECDERMEIFSYPGSFVRIYTNLIMNSLIHGFEGMDDGRINIEIKQLDGQLEIRYWDNGRGIPEAIRHKIFDPFVTSKRGHGGSGLGTHIVYNLVTQLLKGSIRCESERDEGALFEIKLPLSSQVSPAIKGETWD